jgi:membrane protease YdiL (CAAX protease family)
LLLLGTELPRHPQLIFILFPLGTVSYSIFFGWLRSRSGSIWPPSLAHSAVNNLRSPLLAALFATQSNKLALTLVGLVLFAMVAVGAALADTLTPVTKPS